MISMTNEQKANLLAAQSAEEAAALLNTDGQKLTPKETAFLWEEIKKGKEQDGKELSLAELEAVSGGADRDWLAVGCAATVEPHSWCDSNDACFYWDVTYDHKPVDTCPFCGGYQYKVQNDGFQCSKCGKIEYQAL